MAFQTSKNLPTAEDKWAQMSGMAREEDYFETQRLNNKGLLLFHIEEGSLD